ncbi:TM0106 family RecB-like putative nuclease [Rhizobium laguerreae]|uniref:TM0106 family RecB-like putative nuclease n=1 Tax=Rhizobium laguerreae TaxID=1076926 RepID=UPI001C8FD2AE|nr:TM0106 family RecB-like putative nuclease [Rhizobium laguerreae]MBY3201333.1 TM0106 family RecB-like putative nuclease [Rhizobium laguerreae]
MRRINGELIFSPSDLVVYFQSPFASWMERATYEDAAWKEKRDPEDPLMRSLAVQGAEHEASFNASLADGGIRLVEIERGEPAAMSFATMAAMKRGVPAIAQGHLQHGRFAGIADLLIKKPAGSKFGGWSYEVWDTKLSRSMKPYFAVQLCAYAEMLEQIQGVLPEEVSIVLGTRERVSLRTQNFMPYYRSLKRSFLAMQDSFDAAAMPDPGLSSEYGDWSEHAADVLERRDHLRLVANITKGQIKNLNKIGIATVAELAAASADRVPKISDPVFTRLKRQAALQIASRGRHVPAWELADHSGELPMGLRLLPPPSRNDVFFDIEGFPLVEGGLEYLWGATYYDGARQRAFKDFWAHDRVQEKKAFGEFIDWAYARWLEDAKMHIYHYAAYEVSAVRRLMGRHGIREYEVDQLLRNNVFVDLYQVVRQALIVGEPRYSIKNIEHLYRPKRKTEVASGGDSVVVYEQWRETPDGADWTTSKVLNDIRDYNKDDCDSTEELTRWLRGVQERNGLGFGAAAEPKDAPRRDEKEGVAAFRERLLNKAQQKRERGDTLVAGAVELVAHSLEFHEREAKPQWWKYFDRLASTDVELFEDPDCIAGLVRTATAPVAGPKGSIYEYCFDPEQEFKGGAKEYVVLGMETVRVSIEWTDDVRALVGVFSKSPLPRVLSLLPYEFVNPKPIPTSILKAALAADAADFPPSALMDFLTRSKPRIRGHDGGVVIRPEGDLLEQVVNVVRNLDDSCLCIQGPPGAGKTYSAGRVILALLREGRRIGVMSNSHKAVNNVLLEVLKTASKDGIVIDVLKVDREPDRDPELYDRRDIVVVKDASAAAKRIGTRPILVGGTAWTFANEQMHGIFDYLFVDEAGQVSVANLIGTSLSARNIVLMGDQMQLAQPTQGTHPGQSGLSLLEYYMQDRATIPTEQGVFLPTSFRMHPHVCAFISEAIYEGRLNSEAVTFERFLVPCGELVRKGTGILFVGVEHEGNTQASDEEVATIVELVADLLKGKYSDSGLERPVKLEDILFITPYNHQRRKLEATLGTGAKVGTVDKFQGQEAPVVIISMCSSDVNESPRGMDFLFSKNRLNVAISRAKSLAIVVGSPALGNASVSSLRQMELAALFCRVLESCSMND